MGRSPFYQLVSSFSASRFEFGQRDSTCSVAKRLKRLILPFPRCSEERKEGSFGLCLCVSPATSWQMKFSQESSEFIPEGLFK